MTWSKTFLPLASLLWHIFTQQGLSSEMNLSQASSAPKACYSQVMAVMAVMAMRERPTGLAKACKEIIWMLPEDSRLHSAPRICTKAPLNAFSSLVIFKAQPKSQHSPWRSGFSILPTPSIFGQICGHAYLLEEIPSPLPFYAGRSASLFPREEAGEGW